MDHKPTSGDIEMVKIANAKYRFFGAEDFRKCPCSRDYEHYCCSQLCQTDIRAKGTCCCKLFEVKR